MKSEILDAMREGAFAGGASSFGVCRAVAFDRERRKLFEAKRSGMSGPLRFTYSDPARSSDVSESISWASSIITFGWNYLAASSSPTDTGPVIGRFAAADSYQPLRVIAENIASTLRSAGHRAEILIDDNRLLDRAAAVRAGIGWHGRSTMVLTPGHGPWILLGSVVTDAVLPETVPMKRTCGNCISCFPACPTGALSEVGLDGRRCLATWLQTSGSIPHWIRPLLGRRIYGCDDCLTSCPPGFPALQVQSGPTRPRSFHQLLELTDAELLESFSWWYVPRRDGKYIRRNLLVAAGNSGEETALEAILGHLEHPSSLIRGHAVWALAKHQGRAAKHQLGQLLAEETYPEVIDEIRLAILSVTNPDEYLRVLKYDEWAATTELVESLAVAIDGTELTFFVYPETGDRRLFALGRSVGNGIDLSRAVLVNDRSQALAQQRRLAQQR